MSDQSDKRYGIIAFSVGFLSILFTPFLLQIKIRMLLFILGFILSWFVPLFITLKIEKRKLDSLGIVFTKNKLGHYIIYSLVGFILITLLSAIFIYGRIHLVGESSENILTYRSNILISLLIQLVSVGLPEELYYRGYLMTRYCRWLGETRGLLLSCFIFGMVHVVSRISHFGFEYYLSAILIGIKTFLTGMVFGVQYKITKSIAPPVFTHIAGNILSVRIITALCRL
jgi:membrane protease YdiL (CAAX protease family)